MRSSKINYAIVGMFVIAMLAGLVVSIGALTGQKGAVDNYFTVYDNVTGVKFGTQVVYEGYPIGQVESVTPQERDGRMEFRVDFSIIKNWRIPDDSQVEIAAPSLLSAVALQIAAGISNAPLKPGDRVNSRAATNVFGAVSSLAEELANLIETDAKPLLRQVTATVEEIKHFVSGDGGVLVRDVSDLVKDITDRIPRIANEIEEFSVNMNAASTDVKIASAEVRRATSPENRKQIETIIAHMDEAAVRFNEVLKTMDKVLVDFNKLVIDPKENIDTIVSESRYVIESVARHIDSINQNMESAARNMNEFSRQIRSNPGLLLGGSPQEDRAKSP